VSNTDYLRSLYAAMDGLLTDLDANGSPETAAASLRYHLQRHGLVIRAADVVVARLSGSSLASPEPDEEAR
jgi:hypothetical protein